MSGHVHDSLKQVDKDSWLIDDRFLLYCRQSLEASDYLWKDGNSWHFSISDAPTPPPTASPLSSDSFPKLIHDTGGASAGFDLGDALLRVKRPHPFRGVTPEPVTLRWLAERKLSFPVPKTLYYTEDANRVYHIVTRIRGRSVDEAWRDLNNEQEQKQYCVTRVAEICQELSAWTSNAISGVDRSRLFDPWLDIRAKTPDLSSENLLRNCQQLHRRSSLTTTTSAQQMLWSTLTTTATSASWTGRWAVSCRFPG